jgi:drug/metabolite transporter (DMT)-like permease
MAAVLLALVSAVLFGGMAITLALALRRSPDAEAGALATGLVALGVTGVIALLSLPWSGSLWPFLVAGIIAPGGSQILYTRAVKEVGPSRASVVVGAAPLVSVTIALVVLHEPFRVPLLIGAVLIVVGGLALAGERNRPSHARAIGLYLAFGSTLFFATRDNIVRHLAENSTVDPQLAAAATLLTGSGVMAAYLIVTRGPEMAGDVRRAFKPFAPSGVLWGLSYAALFEAFYRSRVTVVSPLVATEALFGVVFAAIVLGRSELIGRHVVVGAALIVAGGILIGVFRR